jgi:hypothetical protein
MMQKGYPESYRIEKDTLGQKKILSNVLYDIHSLREERVVLPESCTHHVTCDDIPVDKQLHQGKYYI